MLRLDIEVRLLEQALPRLLYTQGLGGAQASQSEHQTILDPVSAMTLSLAELPKVLCSRHSTEDPS